VKNDRGEIGNSREKGEKKKKRCLTHRCSVRRDRKGDPLEEKIVKRRGVRKKEERFEESESNEKGKRSHSLGSKRKKGGERAGQSLSYERRVRKPRRSFDQMKTTAPNLREN